MEETKSSLLSTEKECLNDDSFFNMRKRKCDMSLSLNNSTENKISKYIGKNSILKICCYVDIAFMNNETFIVQCFKTLLFQLMKHQLRYV